MEDSTLPSVGASFKKWGCCTPFFQNAGKFLITPKKKNQKKNQKI
jgi:hypothetical protein